MIQPIYSCWRRARSHNLIVNVGLCLAYVPLDHVGLTRSSAMHCTFSRQKVIQCIFIVSHAAIAFTSEIKDFWIGDVVVQNLSKDVQSTREVMLADLTQRVVEVALPQDEIEV